MSERAPLASELLAFREPLRWVRYARVLRRAPRGSQPVLVLPGLHTTDRQMLPMRQYLRYLGHDARGWGQGRNTGAIHTLFPGLLREMDALSVDPITLIGWSWGGTISRALARAYPDRVADVISLGTPISGGARHTAFAVQYSEGQLQKSDRRTAALEAEPLPVPSLSIYTKTDGVVSWTASRDPHADEAGHLEVRSCHVGLPMSPAVWLAIAHRLAHSERGP